MTPEELREDPFSMVEELDRRDAQDRQAREFLQATLCLPKGTQLTVGKMVDLLAERYRVSQQRVKDLEDWSNELASLVPDEYDDDAAQETVILRWAKDLVQQLEDKQGPRQPLHQPGDEMRVKTADGRRQLWHQYGWIDHLGRFYDMSNSPSALRVAAYNPLWVLVENEPIGDE